MSYPQNINEGEKYYKSSMLIDCEVIDKDTYTSSPTPELVDWRVYLAHLAIGMRNMSLINENLI